VGISQLRDSKVPADQLPSSLMSATEMAINFSWLMSKASQSMNFADTLGIGLNGVLIKRKERGLRSIVIAQILEIRCGVQISASA